jgi:PST family polysaccharide transporter
VLTKFKALLGQRLTRNLGWYGFAEAVARITRLLTTIIVARATSRADLGAAAAVLTIFELFRPLTNNGIAQAVITAPARELASICAAAHRAVWTTCLGLLAMLWVLSLAMALHGWTQTGALLAALAPSYLLMAPGLVQAYRIQRSNNLRVLAVIATVQMAADNALTAAFAHAGLGAWSLVLPKLLVAPIWLVGVRHAESWRFDRMTPAAPFCAVFRFAAPLLGSEFLNVFRLNLDNVLVGTVLGMQALGTYYFVFNAGIGLSLSMTTALCAALFPHLADGTPSRAAMLARFDRAVLTAVLPVSLLIALQAGASLLYVPMVFGARWHDAAPLVAVLCASAIARPLADAGCQLLRACGRTMQDFTTNLGATCIYLGTFACALPFGLPKAITVLAVTATCLHLSVAAAARLSLAPSRHTSFA